MTDFRMPSVDDFANAEHCVLEDTTSEHAVPSATLEEPSPEAREIHDEIEIRDRLRGRRTRVRLYAEGWADIEVERRRRRPTHHRIDLKFLDAVPERSRHCPTRLLKTAGLLAVVTGLFAIPAAFGWLLELTLTATISGAAMTLTLLYIVLYSTHEKIVFHTLRGRADAIHLNAGLGTLRRFNELVPKLIEAIASAAEKVTDDTMVYLRAEMREHYRLRGTGVISNEECSESTGRILAEFDSPP